MGIKIRKVQPGESKLYREIRLESLKYSPENFGSTYVEQKAIEEAFDIPEIEQVTLGVFTTNTQALRLYGRIV